jgi:ADP-glucose pyrophosphorylase
MVKGLTAPFDSSLNLNSDQTFSKKGTIWREREVTIDKSAQLNNAVVGSGSIIADNVVLTNTVIGRNCVIQSGVVIEDSIVWDTVTIQADCKIRQSIIANNNTLSHYTQLGNKTVLPSSTQFSGAMKIQDNEIFTVYAANGQPFPKEDDSDDDEPENIPIGNSLHSLSSK